MSIWKFKYGWRCRVQVNGETYHGPTFKYKAEAKEWCRTEKQRRKVQDSQPAATLDLISASDAYLDHVQLNYSHRTYHEKLGALERLVEHMGNVHPTEVTPAQISDLLAIRARTQSNNAANKDRKNLKSFYRWLQDIHGLMYDPTGPIRQLPHTKKSRRLIPIQDVFAVIMAAPMPERALLGCYWHPGARRSEVLRLAWAEDINLEERWIRLGTKKNKDGSMVYERIWMNDDLHGLLTQLWQQRDKASPYLFPHYYQPDDQGNNWKGEQRAHRLLARICTRAEVEPFGYHDIRHTVAKYLNDVQKVGIKKVQRILRHRRQTTTEIYLDGDYTDAKAEMDMLTLEVFSKMTHKMPQNTNKDSVNND